MTPNKRDLKAYSRFDGTGRIVPGSTVLRRNKPKNGNWKEVQAYECCNSDINPNDNTISFDYNIENFLDNLGNELFSCNVVVRKFMTGVNLFYDDSDGELNTISDGGDDMYDGGNALNTNLTQLYDDIKEDNYDPLLNIPYTHTQVVSSNDDYLYATPPMDGTIAPGTLFFGTGSSYFTNMYPGLFLLAASDLNGVTQFSISGNLGTDGNGVNFYSKQATSYIGWTAFYKSNNDLNSYGDPSVNHIILVKGSTTGIEQVGDTEGSYDDHALLNLTSANTDIIVVVFSTLPSVAPVTKEQFRNIADAILSVASGLNPCND